MNINPFGPLPSFLFPNCVYIAGLVCFVSFLVWSQKRVEWLCIGWVFIAASLLERVRMIGCYPVSLRDEASSVIAAAPIQFLIPPLALMVAVYVAQMIKSVRRNGWGWLFVKNAVLLLVALACLLTQMYVILRDFDFGACQGQPRP